MEGATEQRARGPVPPERGSEDSGLSTDELVQRLQAGDREAWLLFLDRYGRLLYAVPRKLGLSAEDSADVVQDVLHAFLKGLPRLRKPEALPGWLLRTAFRVSRSRRRTALKRLRASSELPPETIPDPKPDPAEEMARLQAIADVQEALTKLEERCRRVLTALFLGDAPVSYEELSGALGIPMGSLGPTRRRCLDQLLEALSNLSIKNRGTDTLSMESRKRSAPSRRST
jgi:RNA polymerase sigma factor (sigma-70 family)